MEEEVRPTVIASNVTYRQIRVQSECDPYRGIQGHICLHRSQPKHSY
jgi:hypothetical protein